MLRLDLRRSPLALALLLAFLVAGVTHSPPAGGAVVPPGGAPDMVILFTGDVQGYVEPCG